MKYVNAQHERSSNVRVSTIVVCVPQTFRLKACHLLRSVDEGSIFNSA